MINTDVLVVGSSAAGLVAATTGKRVYPNKDFTVVTMMPKTLIPCGIPYIFGSIGSTNNDLLQTFISWTSSSPPPGCIGKMVFWKIRKLLIPSFK